MKPCDQVHAYYQGIAEEYDRSRFGNGYGAFVHAQEVAFVQKWLPLGHGKQVLNLGCGTGRFMEHATVGLDFSENMLHLARQKFPQHAFLLSDARDLPLPNQSMDAVLCLHVLMHQDQEDSERILAECARVIKSGGLLLVDFPSLRRRQLLHRQRMGWHGSNGFSTAGFMGLAGKNFELLEVVGAVYLPIHRIGSPLFLKLILPFDAALCRSPLREYSSYLLLALRRR